MTRKFLQRKRKFMDVDNTKLIIKLSIKLHDVAVFRNNGNKN